MNAKQTQQVPAAKLAPVQTPREELVQALTRKGGIRVADICYVREPLKRRKNESDDDYAKRESGRIERLVAAGQKDAAALDKIGMSAIAEDAIATRVDLQFVQTIKVGKVTLRANSRAALALRAIAAKTAKPEEKA